MEPMAEFLYQSFFPHELRSEAMLHWNCGPVFRCVLLLFAVASAQSQPRASALKPGDELPSLAGQTVTGRPLDILKSAKGNVAVVIYSFSRAGGRDAQTWAEHLTKDQQDLPLYTAIFLESVPRFFRSTAVSAIRSGMSLAMQERTLLLYQQQSLWEQRLHVTNEGHACLLVLDREGHIRWMLSGPFAEAPYLLLRKELQP
jgi:hypothetical protein